MKNIQDFKVLFWDFDGVIMDSMPIRDKGFIEVLKDFPQEQVAQLVAFHQKNGGLSRYVKFRHFYEDIRKESITEEKVNELAHEFSKIMLALLIDETLLISDSVDFIKGNAEKYKMHIVSGSDGKELNHICKELGLDKYFLSIHGSPTPKTQLVHDLLQQHGYNKEECVLIGDSMNDYDAAQKNGISFIGYNNDDMVSKFDYIQEFKLLY
jgi:HAD superfamily hydrolase (TIGR01549 family)